MGNIELIHPYLVLTRSISVSGAHNKHSYRTLSKGQRSNIIVPK